MSEMSVSAGSTKQQSERRFYTGMALLMVALVLIGFGPTFYLKPFDLIHYPRPAPPLTPSLMTHGLVFTLWLLLFLTQTSLVAAGRRDLHRKLGVGGMMLAVMLVPIIYLNAVWQVARASQPPFTDPLTWTAVPLVPVPFYIAMIWLGWRWRQRDLQAHKRLMLGVMIMLTEPAIGRLPIAPPTLGGFSALAVGGWLLFIPLFLWDRRSLGHLHWATRLGASFYALMIAIKLFMLATPGLWSSFAVHLPGVQS